MKIILLTSILIFFTLLSFLNCKPKINQIVNKQKQGLWIDYDTLDFIYKTVGKFKNDSEIGTWKYYNNEILIRKEKYLKTKCKTKFYYLNGNIEKKGYAKTEFKKNLGHWFYDGKWKFYDINGNFIKSEMYYNGKTSDSLSTFAK